MSASDYIGKKTQLVIKETSLSFSEDNDGVILIEGYANKFLDDNGNIIVDRSMEAVLPSGYDIENFLKNPILLYQHFRDEPIGKVINIDIKPEGLYIQAEVHREMNQKAYYGVKNNILKTFSIGFRVKDAEMLENGVVIYTELELLEVSIVSIPDQQDAIFSVLTEKPCENGGVCLLASKALPVAEKAIKNSSISERPWGDVNKTALKQKLAEMGNASYIKEAFLVVRDLEKRSEWKFPHHELVNGDLVVNKGGVQSAFAALKGARNEPNISAQEKKAAARHLLKHYREMEKQGVIDAVPEDLIELSKEFDDIVAKELQEEEGAAMSKQTEEEITIQTTETTKQEGQDSGQDPDEETVEVVEDTDTDTKSGETKEPEQSSASDEKDEVGPKVDVEAVMQFIEEAAKTTDGLNTLLEIYAYTEEVVNSNLTIDED